MFSGPVHDQCAASTATSFKPSTIAAALLLSLTSFTAAASGIFLQEAVIANAGTAGAGDGVYTDSSAAMWTNPATMSHMGESRTTINFSMFDLEMKFKNDGFRGADGDAKASVFTPTIGVFHAQQINEQMHLGISMGIAGGSNLDYGNQWAGRAWLNEIDLLVAQFNPTMAYQIDNQWSVGGGLQISWAQLEQTMAAGQTTVEQSSDWAAGFTFGVMYRHSEALDFGLSYRSKIEHDFSASVSNGLPLGPGIGGVKADIDVPAIVDASVRYGVTSDLNLLASIQFHQWSDWDRSVFEFNSGQNLVIERDWDDVWHFAVGADYRLNSNWRLKAGVSYETSPQNDASLQWVDLPVGDQWRYSVGASTHWDGFDIDLYYEYADLGTVRSEKRALEGQLGGVNGQFDGRIHFFGVGVTF